MDLAQAYALVTGGSSGIGFEIARALKARGAKVAICGRDARRLERAAESIGCLGLRADVSQEDEVERLVHRVLEGLGGYDVLVNNAAVGYFSTLVDIDVERFCDLLATNLTGAMLVARASARVFVPQRRGHIVNVGSTAARRGFANGTPYVASKFALSGMTECWRAELRRHDVRVTQVDPSEVQTPFLGSQPKANPRKLRPREIAHAVLAALALDDRGFIPSFEVWATNPDGPPPA